MTLEDEDPFHLSRFVEAQAKDYSVALAELRAGRKRTHWIWYVLPQLRGLGSSSMATYYGIDSLQEAEAYLAHPVLGQRLRECVAAMTSAFFYGPLGAVVAFIAAFIRAGRNASQGK